jgi:hypothetical protein
MLNFSSPRTDTTWLDSGRQQGYGTEAPKMSDKVLTLDNGSSVYEEPLMILNAVLPSMSLSNVQELVFCQAWQGKAYLEISASSDYDADYLKDVGYRLWNLLSKELGERVTKNNFRSVFRRHFQMARTSNRQINADIGGDMSEFRLSPQRSESWKPLMDLGQAPDVSLFEGRTDELAVLERWIQRDQCRLVGLFGLAGVGKTTLAVKLTERLQSSFDAVIWRSLRNAPPFTEFICDLLNQTAAGYPIDREMKADEQVSQLIYHLRQYRCLLVIDGWTSVLGSDAEALAGRYKPGYEHYGQLLRQIGNGRHQSTLMMTSREKPIGLVFMEGEALPVRCMRLQGLTRPTAISLLRKLGLSGTSEALDLLVKRYGGNPLALKAVTRTILDLFEGNVVKFLEQGTMVYGEIRQVLEQQLLRLSGAEQQLMMYLAQKTGWVAFADLTSGLAAQLSQDSVLETLESLHRRSLIQRKSNHFMQIDMIRESMLMNFQHNLIQ